MNEKLPRPFLWIGLFMLPTLAAGVFWLAAFLPAFQSSSHGFSNRGDSLIEGFLALSVLDLIAVSIAYGARKRGTAKIIVSGVGVFICAILANVIGILAVFFAGCACAVS